MTTLSNTNCPLPLLHYLSSFPVLIGVRVTEFDLFFCEELCRLLFQWPKEKGRTIIYKARKQKPKIGWHKPY
jgi:hypothetical protein